MISPLKPRIFKEMIGLVVAELAFPNTERFDKILPSHGLASFKVISKLKEFLIDTQISWGKTRGVVVLGREPYSRGAE